MRFTCIICGKEHDAADVSFGADAPVQRDLITEEERARSVLSGEQCVIDSSEGRSFYIRCCLEIPIRMSSHQFTWGVWCSLSEKSYLEMSEHWEDPERALHSPYFGWLSTKVPEYPDTVYLKTMVHQRAVGMRPLVELEASDHPLAVDQRVGIDEDRLQHILQKLLH